MKTAKIETRPAIGAVVRLPAKLFAPQFYTRTGKRCHYRLAIVREHLGTDAVALDFSQNGGPACWDMSARETALLKVIPQAT